MENNTENNPVSRALALNSLGSSSGWAIYRERFKEIVEKEIDAKIFDPKTSDEERRSLVAARELLMTKYTPEKIRQSLLVVAENEIAQAERRKQG